MDTEFLQLLTKLKEKRPLKVHHGYVLPQLGLDVSTETGWSQEDPMMVTTIHTLLSQIENRSRKSTHRHQLTCPLSSYTTD